MRTKFISLLYKTNRFHVAVHLSSNRSQRMSKCGKNISDTLGYRLVCHVFVLLILEARLLSWPRLPSRQVNVADSFKIVHFAVTAMFCARVEYWDRLGAVLSHEKFEEAS